MTCYSKSKKPLVLASMWAPSRLVGKMDDNTELEQEKVRAQRACKVGAICMYAVAAISLLMDMLYLYTLTQTATLGFLTTGQRIATAIDGVTSTIWMILLAEFLRNFRKGSPFGKPQSLRLLVAGLALAVQTMANILSPSAQFQENVQELGMTVTSQSDIDLKVIAMIVFLIALSLVIRYGDALKQDSDSIL